MADFSEQVPPEILTEIFKWLHISALSLFESAPVDGGRVFEQCWPVSSICKYWREVALASPFLWTYLPRITVRDNYENPLSKEDPDPYLDRLKELISRAPNGTLHPSFICTATGIEGPHLSGVATYLISRSSQWGSVSISGIVDCIALFFWEIGDRVPCLEALRLEFLEGDEEPDGTELPMFDEAPMLKSVHISGVSEWDLELDTRSLVYLYDGVGGIIHNITATHGFPKLVTLEVHDRGLFDYTDPMEDDFTINLPVLKRLVYKCDDNMNSEEGFLLFPVAPSLEELTIAAPEGDVITHIVTMRDRSAESLPLKFLRILENTMEECIDGTLVELLQDLPDLEVLEMAFPSEDEIDSLAVSEGDEVLVPRLKKCTFEHHADTFDDSNGPINQLIASRCEPSVKKQGSSGRVATMELIICSSIFCANLEDRTMLGFGDGQYGYLGIQPTRLEPWYGDRTVQRSAYTEAVATIPQMLFQQHGNINTNSFEYKHSLELITRVEQKYNAKELVKFLESNTTICMISSAYAFKTRLDENKPYGRILRLLQKVKGDLTRRLDDFHWIWETSLDKIWIRYIPNGHEMRSDPDKFANAVLGITDDLWILEDMQTV
ncbi:hypothetical protein D9619_011541 [Psilocybe cf. subviscida]|uniref:F-box domain-containing protein n=1 Tax=Psilocybe cf. subviscida TaxID=2480587 RepID=A0A8H5F9U2_9AGAR|nr:hypothetical protein D9619_011541 [Psilocybe cf. subviscida]